VFFRWVPLEHLLSELEFDCRELLYLWDFHGEVKVFLVSLNQSDH
jgi:hypothetical protein